MRVLLLFPMADGQTGPAIKYAFEQLGHEVKAVDAGIDWLNSYNANLKFKPDLVFCSRTKVLTEQVERIKQKSNPIICMWNVDTKTKIKKWSHLFSLIRLCNYHFIVDSKTIPEWKNLNPNTFWLPQGLQNELYDKPKKITDDDRERYSCDVSFAGRCRGYHKRRQHYFDAIMGMDVKFNRWGCAGNPKVYNEEHNKMVSLSKINLCSSGWPLNGKYTSVRNYKVMGAGGFALELYRVGIYDIFPGDTLDYYKDPNDLVERIRYWLDHEEERKQVADRAYRWVHENATYTHRIRMALDYMKELNG